MLYVEYENMATWPWDFLFESLYYICLRKFKNILISPFFATIWETPEVWE